MSNAATTAIPAQPRAGEAKAAASQTQAAPDFNAAEKETEMTTETVLQNHLRAARVGVEAVMQDYTDQSILITHDATYRGLAEIRGFFEALFKGLPAGFFDAIKMHRQEIVGEVAYILWERNPQIARATDTFVVRNGKILVQTFAVMA